MAASARSKQYVFIHFLSFEWLMEPFQMCGDGQASHFHFPLFYFHLGEESVSDMTERDAQQQYYPLNLNCLSNLTQKLLVWHITLGVITWPTTWQDVIKLIATLAVFPVNAIPWR
jgi:hypothetical protein